MPEDFENEITRIIKNHTEFFVEIDCEAFIGEREEKMFDNLLVGLKDESGEFKQCYLNYSRSHNLSDLIYLTKILNTTQSDHEIASDVKKLLQSARTHCVFDELVNRWGKTPLTYKEDHCARRYVVAKNLLDTSYNIQTNPHNLNITGPDCNKSLQKILNALLNDIIIDVIFKATGTKNYPSIPQMECIVQNFKDERYIVRILPVVLLNNLNPNSEQLSVEREKFKLIIAVALSGFYCCTT